MGISGYKFSFCRHLGTMGNERLRTQTKEYASTGCRFTSLRRKIWFRNRHLVNLLSVEDEEAEDEDEDDEEGGGGEEEISVMVITIKCCTYGGVVKAPWFYLKNLNTQWPLSTG